MSCQCFTTNKTIMSWHFRSLKADAVWLTHKNNLSSKLIIIQCHLHTVFNDWAQMFYGSVGEWVTNNMNGWQPKKPNGWLLGQTISTWQLSLSSEKKSFYSTNSNYREEMFCFFSTEMKVKHVVCPFPISGNCSSHYWEKKKRRRRRLHLQCFLVSLWCGSVFLEPLVHPQNCRCQLGWEVGKPFLLPQSVGSTEGVTSWTQTERAQIWIYIY